MKKIIIAILFAIPFFIGNSIFAQNGSSPPPQDFQADVTVTTQYSCPVGGQITGYVPILGYAYEDYDVPGDYTVLWNGTFPGFQPCTIDVKTNKNSQGQYCHGVKTKNLSLNSNDITVDMDLMAEGGGGGNEQ